MKKNAIIFITMDELNEKIKRRNDEKDTAVKNFILKQREKSKFSFKDLSVWERLVLGALLCYGTDETKCVPYSGVGFHFNLSSSYEETESIMQYLIEKGYIVLSEINTKDNFLVDVENNEVIIDTEYGRLRYYDIWIDKRTKFKLKTGYLACGNKEIEQLAKDIKVNVSVNYALTLLAQYDINVSSIEELVSIITSFSEKFSLMETLGAIRQVANERISDLNELNRVEPETAGDKFTQYLTEYYAWLNSTAVRPLSAPYKDYNFSFIFRYFYFKVLEEDEAAFYASPKEP